MEHNKLKLEDCCLTVEQAKELGKDPTTISKWCTNQSQPTLEILIKIADLLEVDYTELVRK